MRRTLPLISALLLPLTAAAAFAQTLDASDPEAVRNIAAGYGSATLESDSQGDPRIVGRIGGKAYSVYFYGCNQQNRNCTNIQLWAYFQKGPKATLGAVNEWNRSHRYLTAYIDGDGDVAVKMDVNLFGGVTRANLDDTFDWWRLVIEGATTEFGS